MSVSVGIGLAFVAMLCWGIGDFLIQRSTRKIGNFETLFLITFFGTFLLLPFVWRDVPALFVSGMEKERAVLLAMSLIIFFAALFAFEALKRGKIAVVEPLWSLEIPVTGLIAFFILGERLGTLQLALIVLLIVGLVLVSFRGKALSRRWFLERGVILALVTAVLMGAANFFVGWGARLTDALMVNFILNAALAILSGAYLLWTEQMSSAFRHLASYRAAMIPMIITDNAAWVAYAFAMTLIPIGIATALSESYIVVAVILGLVVGRERLESHQRIGLVAAIVAAVALASLVT